MKKIFVGLAIVFALNSYGQTINDNVKQIYDTYLTLINENNPEYIHYIHPLYFKIIPRDTLIKAIDSLQTYINSDEAKEFPITIDSVKTEYISEIILNNKISY